MFLKRSQVLGANVISYSAMTLNGRERAHRTENQIHSLHALIVQWSKVCHLLLLAFSNHFMSLGAQGLTDTFQGPKKTFNKKVVKNRISGYFNTILDP